VAAEGLPSGWMSAPVLLRSKAFNTYRVRVRTDWGKLGGEDGGEVEDMGDFIERFTARNYGCLKDVTVALTPLHAFIGPNDSGKSTLLRAMRTAVQLAGSSFTFDEQDRLQPFDPDLVIWPRPPAKQAWIEIARQDVIYRVREPGSVATVSDPKDGIIDVYDVDEEILVGGHQVLTKRRKARSVSDQKVDRSALRRRSDIPSLEDACRFFMRGARMLRLDPDAMREPSKLITSHFRIDFEDEHGRGLPGIYDVILNQHLDAYVTIQENVRRLFPSVTTLGLENMTDSTKEIRIRVASGEWIPARFMSEGMLYYLAFEAIRYLAPKALLLVEEPENGLHPARIIEVMRILREISKTTQVLLATHSPLVINEMQPEEVSVVTRKPQEGTKVTPMKETANFEKRSSVYALGELWLSFADGVEEAPLLEGRKAS
jgi:predicted ATPase